MKKLLALLLSVLVVISLFAGCGGGGNDDTTPSNNDATQGTQGDDSVKATWPEDLTLTIGLANNALVEDHDTNAFTLWLEEESGIDLEFELYMPMENDYKSKLSTAMVSGDELPDVLFGFNLGRKYYQDLGEDGYLVDLAPYFEDRDGVSKIWWDRFETLDEYYQSLVLRNLWDDEEDNIWAMPRVENSTYDVQDHQAFINHVWLEKLSLEMPQSPDDLYKVLKAFKTQDPNGNGKADEIPLIGTSGSLSGDTMSWLINMFIYCDESKQWNVDENGNVYLPQTTDAYREALTYIRKLYKEGLLSPLTLSSSSADLQQMVCPAGDGDVMAGIVVCHITLGFVQGHEGLLQYEALPLWGNAIFNEDQYSLDTFITKDCKNVDAAWKLLMTMYSEESAVIQRYGEEGTNWDWAPEGSKSVIGEDRAAQIRLYNDIWSTQSNACWMSVGCTILYNAEGEGNQSVPAEETPVNLHKYKLFNDMLDSYYNQQENYNPPAEQICPLLVWPENYKEQLPTQRSDCPSVISKYRTDFITGKLNIESDADWNAYLNQLKNVGVQDWQYYAQLVYNETINK